MAEIGSWLKERSTGIYMIAYIIYICVRVGEFIVDWQIAMEEIETSSYYYSSSNGSDDEKLEQLTIMAYLIDAAGFAVWMWVVYLVVKQRRTFLQKFKFTEGFFTRFVAILIFFR